MLAILIEAYHKGEFGMADQAATSQEYLRQYGPDEATKKWDEYSAALPARKNAALSEAVAKLQKQLEEESFAKLTEYLKSGKFDGSYVWGVKIDHESRPDPCPPNNNPPPGQTTHLACADIIRGDVFDQVAWRDRDLKGEFTGKTNPEAKLTLVQRKMSLSWGVDSNAR